MERYCKTCAVCANKTVSLKSMRDVVAHVWAKHGPFIALVRWWLKRRVKARHAAYTRTSDSEHPMDYQHWEQLKYGDNINPRKYDL